MGNADRVGVLDASEVGLAVAFPEGLRAHLADLADRRAPVEAAVAAGWAGLEALRLVTAEANGSVAAVRPMRGAVRPERPAGREGETRGMTTAGVASVPDSVRENGLRGPQVVGVAAAGAAVFSAASVETRLSKPLGSAAAADVGAGDVGAGQPHPRSSVGRGGAGRFESGRAVDAAVPGAIPDAGGASFAPVRPPVGHTGGDAAVMFVRVGSDVPAARAGGAVSATVTGGKRLPSAVGRAVDTAPMVLRADVGAALRERSVAVPAGAFEAPQIGAGSGGSGSVAPISAAAGASLGERWNGDGDEAAGPARRRGGVPMEISEHGGGGMEDASGGMIMLDGHLVGRWFERQDGPGRRAARGGDDVLRPAAVAGVDTFGGIVMAGGLVLGPVLFRDFEIPERIRFGGRQRLVVHVLPGGGRVVDSMGADETPLSWSGVFSGRNAASQVRLLERLRRDGSALPLSWEGWRFTVVIQSFEAQSSNPAWVPYRIEACVVAVGDVVSAETSPGLPTVAEAIALGAGNDVDGQIGVAAAGLQSDDIATAIASAGSLAQLVTARAYLGSRAGVVS